MNTKRTGPYTGPLPRRKSRRSNPEPVIEFVESVDHSPEAQKPPYYAKKASVEDWKLFSKLRDDMTGEIKAASERRVEWASFLATKPNKLPTDYFLIFQRQKEAELAGIVQVEYVQDTPLVTDVLTLSDDEINKEHYKQTVIDEITAQKLGSAALRSHEHPNE